MIYNLVVRIRLTATQLRCCVRNENKVEWRRRLGPEGCKTKLSCSISSQCDYLVGKPGISQWFNFSCGNGFCRLICCPRYILPLPSVNEVQGRWTLWFSMAKLSFYHYIGVKLWSNLKSPEILRRQKFDSLNSVQRLRYWSVPERLAQFTEVWVWYSLKFWLAGRS